MRQLKFSKAEYYGNLVINMRVIGGAIYMKVNNDSPQKKQIIQSLVGKGAKVKESNKGWIHVDMFSGFDSDIFTIDGTTFNIKEIILKDLENLLASFYLKKFKEAKFKIEVIE